MGQCTGGFGEIGSPITTNKGPFDDIGKQHIYLNRHSRIVAVFDSEAILKKNSLSLQSHSEFMPYLAIFFIVMVII
jgi:hypothetical protein